MVPHEPFPGRKGRDAWPERRRGRGHRPLGAEDKQPPLGCPGVTGGEDGSKPRKYHGIWWKYHGF